MQAFRALQGLIMSVVLTAVDDKHANPIWPAMGYPGQPSPLLFPLPPAGTYHVACHASHLFAVSFETLKSCEILQYWMEAMDSTTNTCKLPAMQVYQYYPTCIVSCRANASGAIQGQP